MAAHPMFVEGNPRIGRIHNAARADAMGATGSAAAKPCDVSQEEPPIGYGMGS